MPSVKCWSLVTMVVLLQKYTKNNLTVLLLINSWFGTSSLGFYFNILSKSYSLVLSFSNQLVYSTFTYCLNFLQEVWTKHARACYSKKVSINNSDSVGGSIPKWRQIAYINVMGSSRSWESALSQKLFLLKQDFCFSKSYHILILGYS